jgi:hypothetical protein
LPHALGCRWLGRLDRVEVELAEELADLGGRKAASKQVSAQVVVAHATVEDVVGGDQDGVANRLGRLGRAVAVPQPLVPGAQVGCDPGWTMVTVVNGAIESQEALTRMNLGSA